MSCWLLGWKFCGSTILLSEGGEPEIYASRQDYEDSKNWFAKLLKKPHRTYKFNEPIGKAIESYSFKRGDIWLGDHK